MSDGRVSPHIGGLFHGVSRQAPLQRAPTQLQDIDNYLPSMDIGGLVDRAGTRTIVALDKTAYAAAGPHHYFRTSDGQRWVLLRRIESGMFEIRNADTGALALASTSPTVKAYLQAGGGAVRFLTIADTTFLANPAVTVAATEAARPAAVTSFAYVKRVSSARQRFYLGLSSGGTVYVECAPNNTATRETVAAMLVQCVNQGLAYININSEGNPITLGPVTNPLAPMTAAQVATCPAVVQVYGPANYIANFTARNDWDEGAVVLIKNRVTATTDLPPSMPEGVSIQVDLGRGDAKKAFYVRYDGAANAYIECSYLNADAKTAALNPTTMPIKVRQTDTNAFTFEHCAWVDRSKGDEKSNPLPFFVGKTITDLATWKGRLVLASQDTLCFSQPDDLFNYWKETARETRAADPIELPTDSPDLANIHYALPFNNKLMVFARNAQLQVLGDKPITSENATMTPATAYALNQNCRPAVIGDTLFYTGTTEGRSALWEYAYSNDSGSNIAFDLSKHVPSYVPGRVRKIAGSSEAGRLYLLSDADAAAVYTQTSYWKDQQRLQNAWSRLRFPGLLAVREVWVDEGRVLVLGETTTHLFLVDFAVDASLGTDPLLDQRLDYRTTLGSGVWNGSYTAFVLPDGYGSLGPLTLTVAVAGDPWVTEFTGSVVSNEFRVPALLPPGPRTLGVTYKREAEFSQFLMVQQDQPVVTGTFTVGTVVLDLLKTGDFTATVLRADRAPTLAVQRTARVVGASSARPLVGENLNQRVPFNADAKKARLRLSTDSTAPSVLTGYTLLGRYTNPYE